MRKEFLLAGLCWAFAVVACASAILTGKPVVAGVCWAVMPTILGFVLLIKGLMQRR